jgi:hypothetical protein
MAAATLRSSVCGGVPCQLDWFEATVHGIPSRTLSMWGTKPEAEDQHERQQHSEHERNPRFHSVLLS